jgi:hypothetical protein
MKWRMDAWEREQSEAETWRKIVGCRGEREDKVGLMREETDHCISRLIRWYMWWDPPCN